MGSLPNSTQGIFDIRKKILAAPFLPLHSIWNHKRASFSSITKIAEFFEWDLFQIQHKEFLTMTKIVRQKERPLYFSGSFCQVIVKNPCVGFGRDPTRKSSKIPNVSNTIEMGHFLIFIWSGAAEIERQIFFFLYKKFLVFNLEGISLQKI